MNNGKRQSNTVKIESLNNLHLFSFIRRGYMVRGGCNKSEEV